MVDQHVGLRCEHDDGRMVSARRQRAAWSEEAEVWSDVFTLPAREPDHLDEVSIVDPASDRVPRRGARAARRRPASIPSSQPSSPARVRRCRDRRADPSAGAPRPAGSPTHRRSGRWSRRPERCAVGPSSGTVGPKISVTALVPLNRDVRVSLLEEIAPGRQPGELETSRTRSSQERNDRRPS